MRMFNVKYELWGDEVLEMLDSMREAQEMCDVKLIIKDDILHAHSFILYAVSPLFKSILTVMKSSEINLEGFPPNAIRHILSFIYTGVLKCPADDLPQVNSVSKTLNISSLVRLSQKRGLPLPQEPSSSTSTETRNELSHEGVVVVQPSGDFHFSSEVPTGGVNVSMASEITTTQPEVQHRVNETDTATNNIVQYIDESHQEWVGEDGDNTQTVTSYLPDAEPDQSHQTDVVTHNVKIERYVQDDEDMETGVDDELLTNLESTEDQFVYGLHLTDEQYHSVANFRSLESLQELVTTGSPGKHNYTCPMCPLDVFKPSRKDKILSHVESANHWGKRLHCPKIGTYAVKCSLNHPGSEFKPGAAHYHCPICGAVTVRRTTFQRHSLTECWRKEKIKSELIPNRRQSSNKRRKLKAEATATGETRETVQQVQAHVVEETVQQVQTHDHVYEVQYVENQ